jgi:hypothetical protein
VKRRCAVPCDVIVSRWDPAEASVPQRAAGRNTAAATSACLLAV